MKSHVLKPNTHSSGRHGFVDTDVTHQCRQSPLTLGTLGEKWDQERPKLSRNKTGFVLFYLSFLEKFNRKESSLGSPRTI